MADNKTIYLYNFLKKCIKFTHDHGYVSDFKVDKNKTIEDILPVSETTGAIIAVIQNEVAEVIEMIIDHYESVGDKKNADKYRKLQELEN